MPKSGQPHDNCNSADSDGSDLRKTRRPTRPANKKLFGRGTVALAALVLAAGLSVLLVQSALLNADSAQNAWMVSAITAGLMIFVLIATLLHNRQKEQDLHQRHLTLADRMEQLEDRTFQLQESEEIHRSACDAFGDAIVHRDLDGGVTFANAAFCELFEVQIENIEGQALQSVPPISLSELSLESNSSHYPLQTREIKLITGSRERWFSWLDLPIRDGDLNLVGYRSVAQDISEHKRHEEFITMARQKAEAHSSAKSRFLATVSHEIRTPMNGILGMSQLLEETELTPSQASFNQAIRTSGTALLHLIEDILDVAKIEADRFELNNEPVQLRMLAEGIIELLATRTGVKNLGLAAYVAKDVPETVVLDCARMRQVLINLIGNAIKFTESGAVSLEITNITDANSETTNLRFAVNDTGPGLSTVECDKIFGEFEQLGEGGHGSAGLGLSISQRIINAMGSDIRITSELGVGSSFWFELEVDATASTAPTELLLRDHKVAILAEIDPATKALSQTLLDCGAEVLISTNAPMLSDFLNPETGKTFSLLFDEQYRQLIAENELVNRLSGKIAMKIPGDQPKPDSAERWLLKPIRTASLLAVLTNSTDDSKENINFHDAPPLQPEMAQPGHRQRLNILLADDNDINVLLVRSKLEKMGHLITVAENGAVAVQKFEAGLSKDHAPFDLILMDMHMPVMNGIDAITAIREIEGTRSAPSVSIIVLSADEQADVHKSAKIAGATGFVAKPISLERLVETIEACRSKSKNDTARIKAKAC